MRTPNHFDFIIGHWHVRHRRLNTRLAQCTQWTTFDGASTSTKILGGFGILEDNLLNLPGSPYRAVAMRSYCANTERWSIWWLDGRTPTRLDQPVVGSFSGRVGTFFADDTLDGRPIRVRFTWHAAPGLPPRWEQAFSDDRGASWETNWIMEFFPAPGLSP